VQGLSPNSPRQSTLRAVAEVVSLGKSALPYLLLKILTRQMRGRRWTRSFGPANASCPPEGGSWAPYSVQLHRGNILRGIY
jgi:hypothetical protein